MNLITENALSQVSYVEGKNNWNKFGEYFNANNQPWCMYFVQWIFAQSDLKLPYFTGSCSALLNWYKKNKPECVLPYNTFEQIPEGSIIIYSWGHTGILFLRYPSKNICTIEGNTSPDSSGSQDNGGGVYVRNRTPKSGDYFIIPEGLVKEVKSVDTIYATIDNVPKDYCPTIQKLINLGVLKGTSKGIINVTSDMCRTFVIMDRLGLIPTKVSEK